jgi:hypothetical protein
MAPLADSKTGKLVLSQAAHMMIARLKSDKARAETILGEEPDLLLDSRQLELCFSRHGDNAAHNGPVISGKNDTSTGTLDDEGEC